MGFNTANDSVRHVEDYSGGYYLGTVTSNTDSLGIARVQANVPGLYDSTQGEVPYIGAIKDSPFGFGTGAKGPYGVYGFPQTGSTVMVELQQGDEHKPLYSTFLTAQNAHPWFNVPARWGYVDPSGNSLQVDMAANTWVWTHESGDSISYDGSGNNVNVVGGNLTFQVTGTANVNCSAFNLNSSGAATYTASQHNFNGAIFATNDITDNTSIGNGQTMANMRSAFNTHRHPYDDNGHTNNTDIPFPQV